MSIDDNDYRGTLGEVNVNGTNIHGVVLSIFLKKDGNKRIAVESLVYPGFIFITAPKLMRCYNGFAPLEPVWTTEINTWLGKHVNKKAGYPYPGLCLSVFTMRDMTHMLAIESDLLPGHIQVFRPDQLVLD